MKLLQMKNSRVNEEFHSANYGRGPEVFPTPAGSKPILFSCTSQAFPLGVGAPSSQQEGVDCSSSQIYHPQPQIEELAFWQSFQKQQTYKDTPGCHHSRPPVQYNRSIEPQPKPLENQQTNKDPPGGHHSQLPQQHLTIFEPRAKQLENQQTNIDPPGGHHSELPQQHLRFFEPQPKPLENQQTDNDPPGGHHSQPPQQYHRFTEPQPKPLENQKTNMDPPVVHHSQWLHQRFFEPQLKSSQWHQTNMEPPGSHHTQLQPQHPSFSERQLKRGGQRSQDVHPQAITPAPHESQSQRLFLQPPLTINLNKSPCNSVQDVSEKPPPVASISTRKNLFKGKGKVTSSSADMQSFNSAISELPGLQSSLNEGRLNTLFCTNPQQEYWHQNLPLISDITLDLNEDNIGWNAILEVMEALQRCSPPRAAIPNPYTDADKPLFDTFFFVNSGSSTLPGPVINLNSSPVDDNVKDLPSRKGKEMMVYKKRKR